MNPHSSAGTCSLLALSLVIFSCQHLSQTKEATGTSVATSGKQPVALIYSADVIVPLFEEGDPIGQETTEHYVLKIKTDFSEASLNGAMYPLRKTSNDLYTWDHGDMQKMSIRTFGDHAILYNMDGEQLAKLERSGEEYQNLIGITKIEWPDRKLGGVRHEAAQEAMYLELLHCKAGLALASGWQIHYLQD